MHNPRKGKTVFINRKMSPETGCLEKYSVKSSNRTSIYSLAKTMLFND